MAAGRAASPLCVHQYRQHHHLAPVNYRHGQPRFYVGLDENGGEGSWVAGPEQAERLGKDLLELGARCRQLNIKKGQRRAELARN